MTTTNTKKMHAIVIADDGALAHREVALPEPGPGQARVRIRACGVNRADLMQRLGRYPAPADAPKDIPGLEIAGEVEALGAGPHEVAVGDAVYGIVGGGAYAEAVVVHSRTLAPIPKVDGEPLDFTLAAALPEATLTAYDAMVRQAGLAAGETVLVHAVGSGVGTAAVQIARAIGAIPIGTARSKDKLERVKGFGMQAGVAVDTDGGPTADGRKKEPRFAEEVRAITKAITGREGADVVLELVGGNYVPESLAALAYRGRLVLVGLMAGVRAEVDLGVVLRQRLRVVGTVLRSRPLEEKIEAAQVLERNISPLIAAGRIVPIVDKVFPLAEAKAAMDFMASNASFGKIVLTT